MNYFVQAENFASDSENQIHSDEVAQRYGFQAALVPGVTVYGYLTTPLVQRFGHEWLSHSVAEVRLIKPTYDGDRVRIEMDDNDACVVVSAFNAADEILATLTSTTPNDLPALNNVHLLDGDFTPPPAHRNCLGHRDRKTSVSALDGHAGYRSQCDLYDAGQRRKPHLRRHRAPALSVVSGEYGIDERIHYAHLAACGLINSPSRATQG